ncbi:MAG: protein translocase subunit SecD [Halothermotrichaceae bacterium]
MKYKQKRILKLSFIIGLIILSLVLYLINGIILGLDLEGGSKIVLQAQETEQREVTEELMSSLKKIITRRVNALGLSEANVQVQGDDRLIVELPAIEDPSEAIENIGKTAMLTLRNVDGEVLMTGDAIKDAKPDYGRGNKFVVQFELTNEGSSKFEAITREYKGKPLAFYLDDQIITDPPPTVSAVIRGSGVITGYDTFEAAKEHAILIREGALPIPVKDIEQRVVGPTLGEVSLHKSINAGLIGLILVGLYMTFYYRFPGFLAAIVLAIYGVLLIGTLAGLNAVLTLPGIAGLILSIGMAVDANIIIFERIKDERRNGKTIKAAINAGFKRAYTTIIDANVTTIITALTLASFTSGVVRGFAITLGMGVAVSMFTAFFVTRNIIDLFSKSKLLKSSAAFGVKRGQQ